MVESESQASTAPDARYQIVMVALLSLNFGILFFDRNALNFLMPFVVPDLHLSNTQVGLTASAPSFTWALSGFLLGAASDRSGRRKAYLVGATFAFAICSFMSGLATTFLVLLGSRLLMGVAEGGVLPISQSMTAASVSVGHRGLAMGVIQNFGSNRFGSFFAPVLLVSYLVVCWAFMPLFLTKMRGFSPTEMGWLMGTLGISSTLGSFVVPGLSDWVGRKPVMIVVPLLGLILPLGALYYTGSAWGLAGIFFFGWALNGVFPMFMGTIPSETVSPRHVATALGVVMGTGEVLGGAFSPTIAGWAADVAGLTAPLWIMAGLCVLAGLLAIALTETAPRALARRAAWMRSPA
jgi:MFS family permease